MPGTAILDSYTTAGQFQIVNGQLVELVPGGQLYANVEEQVDANIVKLAVTFKTTQNTYGRFSYNKYALEWSVATINRPDLSAWLVCDNQQLFLNLGPVADNTPAGCVDQTVSNGNIIFLNDISHETDPVQYRCQSYQLNKPVAE